MWKKRRAAGRVSEKPNPSAPSEAKSPGHPLADLVLDGPHVVGHGHDRARAAGQLLGHPRHRRLGLRVEERGLVAAQPVTAQLVPRGHRPHVGHDVPVVAQQLLGLERPRHADAGREQLHPRRVVGQALGGALGVEVEPAQDALAVDVLGLGRLHHRLVVDGEVVDDVALVVGERVVGAVHPVQAVLHDVRDLERERRVVVHDRRVGRGQQRRSGRRRAAGPRR